MTSAVDGTKVIETTRIYTSSSHDITYLTHRVLTNLSAWKFLCTVRVPELDPVATFKSAHISLGPERDLPARLTIHRAVV
jgi:hypothetical protein